MTFVHLLPSAHKFPGGSTDVGVNVCHWIFGFDLCFLFCVLISSCVEIYLLSPFTTVSLLYCWLLQQQILTTKSLHQCKSNLPSNFTVVDCKYYQPSPNEVKSTNCFCKSTVFCLYYPAVTNLVPKLHSPSPIWTLSSVASTLPGLYRYQTLTTSAFV